MILKSVLLKLDSASSIIRTLPDLTSLKETPSGFEFIFIFRLKRKFLEFLYVNFARLEYVHYTFRYDFFTISINISIFK